MSNAGLEAMERGLPVILTHCGGLDRYVTPDMGWVVTPEDEESLSEALAEALELDLEALSSMGMRARECVVKTFDMEIVAKRYLALFQTLASGNAQNGAAGNA